MADMKEMMFAFQLPALYEAAAGKLKRMCGFLPGTGGGGADGAHEAVFGEACVGMPGGMAGTRGGREGMSGGAGAACGGGGADGAHEAMFGEACGIHEEWQAGVSLNAIAVFLEKGALSGGRVSACGVSLSCPVFASVDTQRLTNVILYAMALDRESGGRWGGDEAPSLSAAFYADVWANAYLEAAVEGLRARLLKSAPVMGAALLAGAPAHGAALSCSFGPGLHGMEITEIFKLASIVDFSKIGAYVAENASIQPAKSCCGILFAAAGGSGLPQAACGCGAPSCSVPSAERHGCRLCAMYGVRAAETGGNDG
ncbi:MAG: hypothetical protein LBH39_01900 [Clostridiales Family XIII bacterium]|nr:hypothetical protein [Clostridiales Family XIII bacterium]